MTPSQFDNVEISGLRLPKWVATACLGLAIGVMLGVAAIAVGWL